MLRAVDPVAAEILDQQRQHQLRAGSGQAAGHSAVEAAGSFKPSARIAKALNQRPPAASTLVNTRCKMSVTRSPWFASQRR